MDSENITTIAAIIGIVVDVLAIFGYISKGNEGKKGFSIFLLNSLHKKFYAYLFSSATWVLLVLVWFLGVQPYGAFVTEREQDQLIALMLSMPVIAAFLFSIKHLCGTDSNKT